MLDYKLDEALRSLDGVQLAKVAGRLVRVSGMLLESLGCQRSTGQRRRHATPARPRPPRSTNRAIDNTTQVMCR